MKKIILGSLLLFIYWPLFAQDKDHTLASTYDLCKHYTGTIGGRPVVLDMRYGIDGGSNYGGSICYYLDKKEIVRLIFPYPGGYSYPDKAKEYPGTEGQDNESANRYYDLPRPKWVFTIKDDKLIGKRHSASGEEQYDIELHEDYTGSYRMDVMRYVEKETVRTPIFQKCSAEIYSRCARANDEVNKADADFINSSLLRFCGGDSIGADRWDSYLKVYCKNFFSEFRENKDILVADTARESEGYSTYESFITIFPAYNENGMLTLEIQRSGRQVWHSFHSNARFLCLDVTEMKEIQLQNILRIDSSKISRLLEAEARRRFKIPSDKKLSSNLREEELPQLYSHFIVDAIPVTNNIMITRYGINFCYDNGEVTKGGYDDLRLFVSYEQLKDLLKTDFKKRLGM